MTPEEIAALDERLLLHIREAGKVLHMDQSHTATREKIQAQLASDHRSQNPDSGYYDYPTVHDTYGDSESGQVVFAKNGQHTMADYKADGKGVKLSDHKPVKRAYVTVASDSKVKESSAVFVDGDEYRLSESLVDTSDDIIPIRESFLDKNGVGTICVIKPGAGDKGFYSVDSIKEAVKDKIFHKGLHMHLDHQTEIEEASRPENSVRTLAAKYLDNAYWDEKGPEGAAAYAKIQVYPEHRSFIESRAGDIGASVAAFGRKSGKMVVVNGRSLPEVSKFVKAKSNDFVTKAGAGGKLLPLYESYRGEHPGNSQGDVDMAKIEIEESDLVKLREAASQVPALVTRLDRSDSMLARFGATEFIATKLHESKLPAPSQARLRKQLLSPNTVIPMKDNALDEVALSESIKTLVTEEIAYLTECGSTSVVRLPGAAAPAAATPTEDDKLLKESATGIDAAIGRINKRKEATKVA